MVTIQNQISVLNKILLLKEHQERQLNVANDTGSTPPGRRSRKSSSNQDSTNNSVALSGIHSESVDKISNPSKTCEDKSSKSGKSIGLGSEEGSQKSDVSEVLETSHSGEQYQPGNRCVLS